MRAAVQRLAVRSARGPLRRPWAVAYDAAARLYGRWLARAAPGATVYARGSVAARRPVPGLADLDLVVVVASSEERAAVEARHAALAARRRGLTDTLLEAPRVHVDGELGRLARASIFTVAGAAYAGGPATGAVRHLERPGLDPLGGDWRRLRGPERRPSAAEPEALRLRGWLEVQYRWRWAWRALAGELPPARGADVMAKLVLETARVGEGLGARAPSGDDVAHAASVAARPDRPADEDRLLATALALAEAVADALAREGGEEADEVALLGAAEAPVPLADWRAVVRPWPEEEALLPRTGPASRASLARAHRDARRGLYPALRHGPLVLVAPGKWARGALRAVQCAVTDPVSFALLDGRDTARFARAAGWSIEDWARRAVAEHAARPRAVGSRLPPEAESVGLLVAAARAALLQESVRDGEPVLPLTARATLRLLAERHPAAAGVADAVDDGPADRRLATALADVVWALPLYGRAVPA